MSEYWKSIPKIYCSFCKTWYQDNKASKDFHERSFKHKNNIKRHIHETQKRSFQKQKEENEFKAELQKIESAALAAYSKDMLNKPTSSFDTIQPFTSKLKETKKIIEDEKPQGSRFGDQDSDERLRKEALDLVSNKLKKKYEWFESKTIEGKTYYYNRVTMETKWTTPKNGFVSIEDQKDLKLLDVPGDQSSKEKYVREKTFKHEQFGKWEEVKEEEKIVDFELPKAKTKPVEKKEEYEEKFEFKEKVLEKESLFKKRNKDVNVGFKKKKLKDDSKKQIRVKTED